MASACGAEDLDLGFAELCPSGTPCRIDIAEHRGISLAQLVFLIDFLRRRCSEHGVFQDWVDRGGACSGSSVRLQAANLYHINEHLIMPATAVYQCSFVELVATRAEDQVPEYFVSHFWGEPVVHFVMCLQQFVLIRRLTRAVFWVCAYANNQHNLHTDVASDPANSSFRRALDLSKGMLMVLDSSATPFSRVWCVFEVFTTLSHREKTFDFAAFVPERPSASGDMDDPLPKVEGRKLHFPGRVEIITDGYVPGDHETKGKAMRVGRMKRPQAGPMDMKASRESSFPMGIALRAIETRVQTASASVVSDRMHILNAILKNEDLDAIPPQEHANFDAVNGAIRSRFAVAIIMNVARDQPEQAGKFIRAIYCDTSRTQLDLQVSNSRFSNGMLQELVENLHCGMQSLDFGLGGSLVKDDGVVALGHALERLTELSNFSMYINNEALTDAAVIALGTGISALVRLSTLSLYFTNAQVRDPGAAALARGLTRLQQLGILCLGFSFTPVSDEGLTSIAEALCGKSSLRHLQLTANNTRVGSKAAAAVARCVSGLNCLSFLWLGFYNTRVDDHGAHSAFLAARGLDGLTKIYLDFSDSKVASPCLRQVVTSRDALRYHLAAFADEQTANEESAGRSGFGCCRRKRVHPGPRIAAD